jgi:gluconate 5-dehydrogenase
MDTEREERPSEPGRDSADWLGLAGKAVLLVGAGGFGFALTKAYLDAGCRVVVADVDKLRLEALMDEVGSQNVVTVACDVTEPEACANLVDRTAADIGLDVFVHAAGINIRTPVADVDQADWQRILDVNLTSCYTLGRRVGEIMCSQGHGKLVYFSSVSGQLAHPKHAAYAASKGALNQLLKVMAVEWAPAGITVNAIAPGYATTPLTEEYRARPGVMSDLLARIPMGRLASADDVVGASLFFSSPRSDYITGQVLLVDGGRTLD